MGGQHDPAIDAVLGRLDDATIDTAIQGVRQLYGRWQETLPGGTLGLSWPLSCPGEGGRGERW